MQNRSLGTAVGAIAIAVASFLAGFAAHQPRVSQLAPSGFQKDGNPIGFHLAGFANVNNRLNLTACPTAAARCQLNVDIHFTRSGPVPSVSCGAVSDCLDLRNLPGGTIKIVVDKEDGSAYTYDHARVSGTIKGP